MASAFSADDNPVDLGEHLPGLVMTHSLLGKNGWFSIWDI